MAQKYSYDVFLVSAIEDRKIAELVARRLRSLKMKVWFDKDREDRTFDSEDAASVEKSRNMLVLWSTPADVSDWVHAAARTGRSRDILIQTAIDDVVPRDPFHLDDRIDLKGLSGTKTTAGFLSLVGLLGASQGRKGLEDYVSLKPAEREEWYKKYGKDPITIAALKPKKAKVAATADAGPYISEMRKREAEWAAWTAEGAAGLPYGVPSDLSLVGGIADRVKADLRRRGAGTLAALANLPDEDHEKLETGLNLRKGQIRRQEWVEQARELLDGKPPRAKVDQALWNRYIKDAEPAPARLSAPAPVPVAAGVAAVPASGDYFRVGILSAILSAIALMFFFGWLFGKDERQALLATGLNQCPAGQYPVPLMLPSDSE
ncbi:MAG: hypothetical protein CMK07_13180 [Ponticaulis sp.]|nr:hypothetical protein [Ponticaulis sp.]